MVLNAQLITSEVRARVKKSARTEVRADFYQLAFQAMGTHCRICFRCGDARLAEQFPTEAMDWVSAFEARYSRFLPGSILSQINAAAGRNWVEIDPETEQLLQLCHEMVFLTQGAFDPAALPLIQLWNWKANPPVIPAPELLAATRARCGWRLVQRRPGGVFLPAAGMALDFGGIGKEYAVDRVLQLALQRGLTNVLVDFGHDIRVHGQPPERGAWHIGLDDPARPGKCWTGLAVTQQAVTTSGDYLRAFQVQGRRYGHIIDPRSGEPVNNGCRAVTVIAAHCTLAGILSTAAFVLGPHEGLNLIQRCPGTEGCVLTDTARLHTRRFTAYVTN